MNKQETPRKGLITVSKKDYKYLYETCKKNGFAFICDAKDHDEKVILKFHPEFKEKIPYEISSERYIFTWEMVKKLYSDGEYIYGDSPTSRLAQELEEKKGISREDSLNLAVNILQRMEEERKKTMN